MLIMSEQCGCHHLGFHALDLFQPYHILTKIILLGSKCSNFTILDHMNFFQNSYKTPAFIS